MIAGPVRFMFLSGVTFFSQGGDDIPSGMLLPASGLLPMTKSGFCMFLLVHMIIKGSIPRKIIKLFFEVDHVFWAMFCDVAAVYLGAIGYAALALQNDMVIQPGNSNIGSFSKWWIPKSPWVSLLKLLNDLDDLGYHGLGFPPYDLDFLDHSGV